MKRTFQVLVLAVLCLLGTDTFAQKIKLGHFNSNELMQKMPEAKQAETQLQEYMADLQAEMELMNQEYNRLMQEYEAKKDQLTDLLKANKENEIKSVVERMQNFQRQSEVSIQEKQMESVYKAMKPFKERLEDLEITFDLPSYEEWENGYVDHEDWYQIRMKEIFEDDDELIKFLFNDESYIEGGNDNG